MQVCKCGHVNEDTTLWCRHCSRKLFKNVDTSKQTYLCRCGDTTPNSNGICDTCEACDNVRTNLEDEDETE